MRSRRRKKTNRPNKTFCLRRSLITERNKSHSQQEKRSEKEQSMTDKGGAKNSQVKKIRGGGKPHTRTTEFLALDLPDAFVGKATRAGTAGAAGLDRVGAQIVGQPLQVTVTDKWVLSQMTADQRGRGR